jgi:hypothetical protein
MTLLQRMDSIVCWNLREVRSVEHKGHRVKERLRPKQVCVCSRLENDQYLKGE